MESELSVTDILTNEFVGVSESDTVVGAVQLMRDERVSCVLVVRGADPVGIVTEWDILEIVAEERDPAETTVGDVMTAPVITLEPDRSLADAATLMGREDIRNVVIQGEGDDDIRGIVTQRDVIAAAGSFQAAVTPGRSSTGSDAINPEQPLEESVQQVADDRAEVVANGGDEYTTQGVCETCGSLADSLWEANGQLVCPDCRTV
ncbi:CBS domain-containing protein [Natronolimnobius sp. AArcel1]|uniref:CBS domain-containing protein n=1 Tax=Natronolimnobius sp. AArcel1 TaxID=1679093 RepID=UPI0013EA3FCA|nr:CBS domain-containing protein [Natronolimnobius sp. AArcel1]NGM71056.1 CBS domain-containing protein [Natronolimnobius sp. AArcel1]